MATNGAQAAWMMLNILWPLLFCFGFMGMWGRINLVIAQWLWEHHRPKIIVIYLAVTLVLTMLGPLLLGRN